MALDGLAGILAPIVMGIIELSVYLLCWISVPFRFVFSSRFRSGVITQWRKRPWLAFVQIPSTLVLIALSVWVFSFIGQAVACAIDEHKNPEKARQSEERFRALEKEFTDMAKGYVQRELQERRERKAEEREREADERQRAASARAAP